MPPDHRAHGVADRLGGQRRGRRPAVTGRRDLRLRHPPPGKRCKPRTFVATAWTARRGLPGALRREGGGGAYPAPDHAGGSRALGPPGDRLSGVRQRPCAHVVRGHLSRRARCGHVALHAAGRRRFHPARRRRCGHLRQPQRAVRLPPHGPDQRTGGPPSRRHHPAADLRLLRGPGGRRAHPGPAGGRQEHADGSRRRRGHRAAADVAAGGAGLAAPGRRFWSAMSPR